MSPSTKLNALIASTTVSLMYAAISAVSRIEPGWSDNALVSAAVGLLLSAGVYRLLTVAIRWLMERNERVRALVLGPYYLHGTWVGYFKGHNKDFRYTVEHYSQDLESVVILGRSYTENRQVHGFWMSDAVSIDAAKGSLLFTYAFDVVTRDTTLYGVNSSMFERRAAHKPPVAISGFAHDLNDKTRIAMHAEKVSDDLISCDAALALAIEKFSKLNGGARLGDAAGSSDPSSGYRVQ
ncbi:hypothetical protein [Massilia sp. TN1-12]|uniref:hypothetical protein n=1 Tax=Massilia paldalensis TaxID=3377675 RepID=UPI00384D1192